MTKKKISVAFSTAPMTTSTPRAFSVAAAPRPSSTSRFGTLMAVWCGLISKKALSACEGAWARPLAQGSVAAARAAKNRQARKLRLSFKVEMVVCCLVELAPIATICDRFHCVRWCFWPVSSRQVAGDPIPLVRTSRHRQVGAAVARAEVAAASREPRSRRTTASTMASGKTSCRHLGREEQVAEAA